MKKQILFIIAAAAAMIFVSCDRAELEARRNPYKSLNLTTKSAEFVGKGNSTFTFEFIDRVNSAAGGSYFVSPLSLQFLLGMTLNGAQGETAGEICDVLGYGAGETDAVNDYAQEMLKQLPGLDKKTKLTIANAIFADKAYPLLPTYESALQQHYAAEVENLDFSDGPATLKRINDWCSNNTNGLFKNILDKVDPEVQAYLLNAMYFKSQWAEKFEKKNTSAKDFYVGTCEPIPVQMMKQVKKFDYSENESFQAVRLPYGNGAYSMVVLLPMAGRSDKDITAFLKQTDWNVFLRQMDLREVDLWLPKFETTYHIDLEEMLAAMGMPLAFNPAAADFSAMAQPSPYLSAVTQDAIVKVDEEGTEAAVVSKAHFGKATAAPFDRAVFHADHPFLYLITEKSTGAVLFAGRYAGQ